MTRSTALLAYKVKGFWTKGARYE